MVEPIPMLMGIVYLCLVYIFHSNIVIESLNEKAKKIVPLVKLGIAILWPVTTIWIMWITREK